MAMTNLADAARVLGATMKLTHVVTNSDLGQWWVKDPLDAWVHGHGKDEDACEHVDPVLPQAEREERQRLLDEGHDRVYVDRLFVASCKGGRMKFHRYLVGLECPHCVGFWVGVAVAGSYVVARRGKRSLAAWRFVAATLSLNIVSVATGDVVKYWD